MTKKKRSKHHAKHNHNQPRAFWQPTLVDHPLAPLATLAYPRSTQRHTNQAEDRNGDRAEGDEPVAVDVSMAMDRDQLGDNGHARQNHDVHRRV